MEIVPVEWMRVLAILELPPERGARSRADSIFEGFHQVALHFPFLENLVNPVVVIVAELRSAKHTYHT